MTKFSLKSDLVKYIPFRLERNWDGDRILSKIAGSTRDFWPSISSLLYPLIFKVFFLYFLFYHLQQIFLKYLFRSMICSGCLLLPLAQACVSFIPDHSYSILSLPLNPCQSIWFLIYFFLHSWMCSAPIHLFHKIHFFVSNYSNLYFWHNLWDFLYCSQSCVSSH